MSNTSLLVHTIDNNLDNIDALIDGAEISTDEDNIVGQIIQEQMNKILENAKLYYLEETKFAKNKDQVFLLEFIQFIHTLIIKKCTLGSSYLIVPQKYKNVDVKIDEKSICKMTKILNYLVSLTEGINNVELVQLDEQIHIKINFKKNKEQGLQIKQNMIYY